MVSPSTAAGTTTSSNTAPAADLLAHVMEPGVAGDRLGRESLSDQLAARLARQIESASLRPGARLPTEAQLCATHGVSRSVVREAVHRLKSRGLLMSRQGSGVFVAAPATQQPLAFDPKVLGSVQAMAHVVEVRRALEGEVAALAAARAKRGQLAALRRALAAIDAAAANGHDGVAEDLAFHRAIADATGNPQFGLLLGFLEQYLRETSRETTLRETMRVTRGNEARRTDFTDEVRAEHHAIVDAIAAGDAAKARRVATTHLIHSENRLERGGVIARRSARPSAARAT